MRADNIPQPFKTTCGSIDTKALFTTVLLIEDESSHVQLISRSLRSVVGEVVHAADGKSAIDALTNSLPELVFCDLNLPDIKGVELVSNIHKARPDLPIIVMTSSSRLDDAVEVMRSGAWDYMVKDFGEDFSKRLEFMVSRTAERKIRQMREIQLRAERDAFSAAVRTASDGLAVLEKTGDVVFSNDAFLLFCNLLNADTDGLVNIVDLLACHDGVTAENLRFQLNSEQGDTLWRTEISLDHGGDKEDIRYYELVLTSIFIGGQEDLSSGLDVRRFVVWCRDVTNRKSQEKFQRDLLSSTSHDLKGPLGAILTSVELLTDHEDDLALHRKQELITRVGSCARNCINLIDELLSARRIQDGVLVVRPRWYKVGEALEDTVLDYLPMAKAKKIDLCYNAAESDDEIFADKLSLHRVLSNLVSNAIKFTPSGGKVELSGWKEEGRTLVSVADTGCGIEPEARHQLFSRYSRLDKHSEVDGTGLGLFVTKNIMDAHDGRIEIQSQVGVGTTFILSFPDEQGGESI